MAAILSRPQCVKAKLVYTYRSIQRNTESWTTWMTVCRHHLKIHFLERKVLYFDGNFAMFVLDNWQCVRFGSGSGLVPNRHQAITLNGKCHHFDEIFITGCAESCHFQCTWTNDDPVNDTYSTNIKSSLWILMTWCFMHPFVFSHVW